MTPGTEVVLSMRGISKRFGPVQALDEVTFEVRRGTVHALCGENGAGKSTLMKILAGVYAPDSGGIELNGNPARFAGPSEALQAGISMIYQELDLAEDLTVAENIFLGAEPCGAVPFTISRRAMNSQAEALAANYGFSIQPRAAVSQLSTADCQIVELLKALRRNASIIVMDEPTSSLSENEAGRLFEVVHQLRSRGLAIIYISHRLEEVLDLADDISILRDGKVVHSAPATGLDLGTIVQHMVGRELKDVFPATERGVHAASTSERRPSNDQASPPTTSTTARTPRVEVRNLSSAEGIHAVSFRIKAGEIVGMAGLVGSGRTEVARALFGVEPKTSGELLLDGQPVDIVSPADAVRNGIALLTEDRNRTGLCLELPCYWNVTLPNLERLGMSRLLHPAVEMRIAGEMAARVRLKWSSPSAPANSLSGGNQQKLLVARWLLAESRFMIFDEPTRGIDIGAKREIYILLQTLAAEGKAILFISSELPELFGVADRILVMRRGRCVGNVETTHTNPSQIMHLAAIE